MLSDLRYALRQFMKSPGFTAVVVLSLALGIGANATVLCWLEGLVLKPLPGVEAPGQMVVLVSNNGGGCASIQDLADFAKQQEVFAGTLATMSTNACLTIDRQAHWIDAQIATANFFELLGVKPILGRTFLPDEDKAPGGNPVLVISERLWRSQFSSDPQIIGRVVDLNRRAFTVIGVVPAKFRGTLNPNLCEAWAPASMISEVRNQGRNFLTQRDARGWHNLARLQNGVSLSQAQAAVVTVNSRLALEYPETNRDAQHRVVPLSECPWGAQTVMGPALKLLLAVCLGVQLIVTANVANLMLARAICRRREIAVRLSAGATRFRLIRQFLTENLLYSLAGGILGVLLAAYAVGMLLYFLPAEVAARSHIEFGLAPWSLGLTLAITLVTGILFGLAPALQATRPNLVEALKDGGRSGTSGSGHTRMRSILVVTEIALALLLLIGAGLCIKGLQRARQIDVGFKADHVLTAKLQVGMNGYDRETGKIFYRNLRQRLAESPQLEEAALASWFPLGLAGCKGWNVTVEGYTRARGENSIFEFAIISPRYFAAMRIPLVSGRDFTDADDSSSAPVAIVNEYFAQRFWPGQDPIGRKFRCGGQWRTIVGVAKGGKYNRVDEAPWSFFYLPYQQGVPDLDLGICVRTKGEPTAFANELRRTVHELDPAVEIIDTVTLSAHSSMALFPQLMAANLLLMLGAIALLLAALGVYAVMAYSVSQRTQEFGVRMALGATQRQVLSLVIFQGAQFAVCGLAVGLALAAVTTTLLSGFLHGVHPFDPSVIAIVSAVLATISLLAGLPAARRATRVDPIVALRSD
ncbi:MAG: ABC transporter permease [Nibricoccus sp.]